LRCISGHFQRLVLLLAFSHEKSCADSETYYRNEYEHGLLAISNVKSSRAVIGDVLKKYRNAGGDVVHVMHHTPDGAPLFTSGTELEEEFPELKGGKGEKVIHKEHPSSFAGTDLKEHLDKIGKKKVVLAGMGSFPSTFSCKSHPKNETQ